MIWQQDFARHKPLFWLAVNFRRTDDHLSNSGTGTIADVHRTATRLGITGAQTGVYISSLAER